MHIIDTVKLKSKIQNPKSKTKPKFQILNSKLWIVLIGTVGIMFIISSILIGCKQNNKLNRPQDYARESDSYYIKAIGEYKKLIKEGEDLDRLYFELGRLYYSHGEFQKAVDNFNKSGYPQAKKFLAISYYRLGNFTDALEVFNKLEIDDQEYLYYHALTCEKLNLFDQALEIYRKIKAGEFKSAAQGRIDAIEKRPGSWHIKEIDPEVYRIINQAPQAKHYPQAGAFILLCDEKVEISPEDTEITYLHYIIKILNERGKEEFSEAHIDYDSTFEKVDLEFARTINPDGTIVDVGSRHIRDVTKYLNFPLYSNARVMIISFPEIAEGSVIEYKLKVYRNKLINKKDFILSYPLQTSEPIISADFVISLPQDRSLHIKTINTKYNNFGAKLEAEVEKKDGRKIYHWRFKDIPQIVPESNMPPSVRINPTLLFSTFESWQQVYNWWWQLAKDKIKVDEAIRKKAKELTRGKKSAEDKARAIYNFCAQKIRYVAVEYGEAGHEPHYASDIFKNKYGDCKDQSILLVAMLREAGLHAYPLLIATRDYYNLLEDFPSAIFNHVIVALYLEDDIIFLDPTAETCSFANLPVGDQGRKVLIFENDGYRIEEIPLFAAEHNLIKHDLKIKLNANESIAAEKSIHSLGFYDQAQRYWLLYTPPELIEEALKERIQDISIGAKLIKYDIKNLDNLDKNVILNYSFYGPEYFTLAGNLRIMPQLASVDTSSVAKDKRRYPLDWGMLDSRENNFSIEIPKNFIIKYMPKDVIEDSPWLKYVLKYTHKGSKIELRQEIQLKKELILEDEYPVFKNFFEDLAKKVKERIVLERIK